VGIRLEGAAIGQGGLHFPREIDDGQGQKKTVRQPVFLVASGLENKSDPGFDPGLLIAQIESSDEGPLTLARYSTLQAPCTRELGEKSA
jgi:hypothetical protein